MFYVCVRVGFVYRGGTRGERGDERVGEQISSLYLVLNCRLVLNLVVAVSVLLRAGHFVLESFEGPGRPV